MHSCPWKASSPMALSVMEAVKPLSITRSNFPANSSRSASSFCESCLGGMISM